MNKRERDAESPKSQTADTPQSHGSEPSSDYGDVSMPSQQRQFASNRRVASNSAAYAPQPSMASAVHPQLQQQQPMQTFPLPISSHELGQIPLHGGNYNFTGMAVPQQAPQRVSQGPHGPPQWYPSTEGSMVNGALGPTTASTSAAGPSGQAVPGMGAPNSYMRDMQQPGPSNIGGLPFDMSASSMFAPDNTGVSAAANNNLHGHGMNDVGNTHLRSMYSNTSAGMGSMAGLPPGTHMDGDAMALWSAAPTGFE